MNNNNDYPTNKELLNAGGEAEAIGADRVPNAVKFIMGDIILSYSLISNAVRLKTKQGNILHQFLKEEGTKAKLSAIYEMFTGEPLDFEPKVKKYDWESVNLRMPVAIQAKIENVIVSNALNLPFDLANKQTALLKLHYIIKELNEDFEENKSFSHEIVFDSQTDSFFNSWRGEGEDVMGLILTSPEAAKILIEQNQDLLKQARGGK